MQRPAYFEEIRRRSSSRWDQLESDPELAGPWHQLFKQVQSPRHVLSELLQNADDAGATETSVRVGRRESSSSPTTERTKLPCSTLTLVSVAPHRPRSVAAPTGHVSGSEPA